MPKLAQPKASANSSTPTPEVPVVKIRSGRPTSATHKAAPIKRRRSRAKRLTQDEQAVLRQILDFKYEATDNEIFHEPDAEDQLFKHGPEIPLPDTDWYHPAIDVASIAQALKKNKGKLGGTVVLNAEQERHLFLQYNYCRHRVMALRQPLIDAEDEDEPLDVNDVRDMIDWYHLAESYRDQIARTNLALVLAMAKRAHVADVDFGDLVSEGNMALLRAIDKFDAARGFKLSTYACRAILKAFSRIGIKSTKYRMFFPTDFDPQLERSDFMDRKHRGHEEDCADEIRLIVEENRADLSEVEQEVIEHRFGLRRDGNHEKVYTSLTLEQVGKLIGVTKERVRQIQKKAMGKIRVSLEDEYLN